MKSVKLRGKAGARDKEKTADTDRREENQKHTERKLQRQSRIANNVGRNIENKLIQTEREREVKRKRGKGRES